MGTIPAIEQVVAAFPLSFFTSLLILLPSIYLIVWVCRLLFPGRAAVLMMSEALVTVLSATMLLPAETMTGQQWFGGAIVLMACLLGR